MNYYISVLKNYATFTGRARRSEFWYFFLFNMIVSTILTLIEMATGFGFLSSIYSLAVFLPSIAVWVRRMHDVGKSGWFFLIPIYSLILACTDSVPTETQYGPNPKEIVVA